VPSSSPVGPYDLRVRLTWLTLFRAVATALLLVVLAVQALSRTPAVPSTGELASYGLIATVFLLTLVSALLLRRGRVGPSLAWAQVLFDLGLASGVTFLTGGLESPLSFVFSIAIIGAAVLLGQRGAVVAAVLGFLAMVLIGRGPTGQVLVAATSQFVAQLLIAVLAGYLAQQLSRAGGKLDEREQDLRLLEDLQNRIVAAMPSGLVTCDGALKVTFVNPAGAAILGLDGETARGLPLEQLMPGVTRARGVRRFELAVKTPRGDRTLGLSLAELEAGSKALLVVFQDLTELRRLEHDLERIDHLAELGRFSAQLAHEIRNPLASVRGAAQMLAGDMVGTPQEKLSRLIMREADRLAGLVDGYLKLARPPPPVLAATRLDLLISETIEMLRADPATAHVTIEEQVMPVEALCDGAQLKQALINLLRNAVRATGAAGQVRVSVAPGPTGPVIEVWDSAGSITPADQQHLFEPFFSRAGSTGLGLSTVQSIVHAHGGTVRVASNPATGTTFSVTLAHGHGEK
jgi:two-component system sensor histidine kinase PilS (NtrC family)